jgi:hypothetical protein
MRSNINDIAPSESNRNKIEMEYTKEKNKPMKPLSLGEVLAI